MSRFAILMLFAAAPSLADAARVLRADPAAVRAADRDGDGRIDDTELEAVRVALARDAAGPGPSVGTRVGSRDRNRDGALTPDELYAD